MQMMGQSIIAKTFGSHKTKDVFQKCVESKYHRLGLLSACGVAIIFTRAHGFRGLLIYNTVQLPTYQLPKISTMPAECAKMEARDERLIFHRLLKAH